jgi:hypothetical protein
MTKSLPNQSLWNYLDLDGNGTWILDGLTAGMIVIVHGLYMDELDDSACLIGGVILHTRPKCTGTFTMAKQMDSATVSNYREELL